MTLSQPLQRPFERLTRAFSKHLPKTLQGEVEPLHQGRVSTRRLREVLPLCGCEVPRGLTNRAQRRLRRVGRALGDVREVDVSIGITGELLRNGAVETEAAERLLSHLKDERDERRERMLDRLSSVNTRKLERDLADIARVLGMRQQSDAWAQMLAVRVERRARRVQEAVREAGALYISDRVHSVRIAVKKLRYALEIAADTGEARTKTAVRELKQLQDVLGKLHDLEVLGATVQDLTVPAAAGEPLNAQLEALRLALDRDCRGLHSQYVGRRDALLSLCDTAVATAARIWTERGGELSVMGPVRQKGRVLRMTIPLQQKVQKTAAEDDG